MLKQTKPPMLFSRYIHFNVKPNQTKPCCFRSIYMIFLKIIMHLSVKLTDAIWLLQLVISSSVIHALSDPSHAPTGIRTFVPSLRGRRLTNWAMSPHWSINVIMYVWPWKLVLRFHVYIHCQTGDTTG